MKSLFILLLIGYLLGAAETLLLLRKFKISVKIHGHRKPYWWLLIRWPWTLKGIIDWRKYGKPDDQDGET